ncbi:MAG TPA: energy-coupling factor transporter transmembrane component T [Bacteroidota bacterium]
MFDINNPTFMRLDIPLKLSLVLLLIVSAFVGSWQTNLLTMLALSSVGFILLLTQASLVQHKKLFLRFTLLTILFSAFIIILNGIFLREGDQLASVLSVSFYQGGLEFGLTTAFRLAVISTSLFLFFTTTPIRELIYFFQHVGVPAPLVVILFLTLHFTIQLPLRVNQIFTAQEARGASVRGGVFGRAKALFVILFPLILSSISETLERGAALEARGFRGNFSSGQEIRYPIYSVALAWTFVAVAFVLIILTILR